MSNVRTLVPIVLATGLGVANGILVFGPEFKSQQEEKQQKQDDLQAVLQSESGEVNIRDAEAAASRASATKSALKENPSVRSWWSSLGFWERETKATVGNPRDALQRQDDGIKKTDR